MNAVGQQSYFKLRSLLAIIALSLATKRCRMSNEARLFQMPDILLKGTITHAFSYKKVYSEDIDIFAFYLLYFRQICAIYVKNYHNHFL